MDWQVVIGLETHVQLKTSSKIFSASQVAFGDLPNTHAAAIDLGLPGTLPLLNHAALTAAIVFGLAVGAKINTSSLFARKNYFYPDLPKGYQISQFDQPVLIGGKLPITIEGKEKDIVLTRAHLEEDAGKSIHFGDYSAVDFNRAGTPLLEIVSEPVIYSVIEAVEYARSLHALVTWLGICDGNMQEGSFRCDANVSIKRAEDAKLGTRAELKNINSFRFLEQAINYEMRRQIDILESGNTVIQETRGYDPDKNTTFSMRSKEDAYDYRYFPDPDLLPVVIPEAYIEDIKQTLPPLPHLLEKELQTTLFLTAEQAHFLCQNRGI